MKRRLIARDPWIGPMLTPDLAFDDSGHRLLLSVGADPSLGAADAVCWVPVHLRKVPSLRWAAHHARVRDIDGHSPPPPGASNFFRLIDPPSRVAARVEEPHCDWLTLRPPDWVLSRQDEHIAVLLIYAQSGAMDINPGARVFPNNTGQLKPGRPFSFRRGLRTLRALRASGFSTQGPATQGLVFRQPFAGLDHVAALKLLAEQRQRRSDISRAVIRALARMQTDTLPLGIVTVPRVDAVQSICLALGSCQYPSGMLDQIPATESWQRLNQRFYTDGVPRPQWLVMPGDQVYVDATAGLFDPKLADDRYRNPYLAWLSEGRVRSGMRRMVALSLPDDHEIDDNWEPLSPQADAAADALNRSRWDDGVTAFLRYQRPLPRGERSAHRRDFARSREHVATEIGFELQANGIPVFMLDTRTRRKQRSSATLSDARLVGKQWARLRRWLLAGKEHRLPMLIVSPSAILPRHRAAARTQLAGTQQDEAGFAALRSDGWDGYPREFLGLLAFIAEQQLERVVFLSGDEHLGLVAHARLSAPGGAPVCVHAVHSPGLYTPYQFANARAADLILNETFEFAADAAFDTPHYRCEVATRTVHGAGFVIVQVQRRDARWWLDLEFDADPDSAHAGEQKTFSLPLD